ncbi:flagellin [Haematobacter sp. UBA3484]|uniref:flagellin n=2 Tax=unclassified Haematobacter TaxID=2640585 RepID=UPI0025C1C271|nr:flagellin [Haematobacter sp. UBA3484]
MMGGMGIGDLARSLALRKSTGATQKALSRAMQEATTGAPTDRSARLGGDHRLDSRLNTRLASLAAWRTTATEAALSAATMQESLTSLKESLESGRQSAILASSTEDPASRRAVANDLHARFGTAVSTINMQSSGQPVFGGAAAAGPAIKEAAEILAGLADAISASGAQTASDIAATVSGWFDTPANYYLGDSQPRSPVPIGAGEAVSLSLRADAPAFRQTLEALALGALSAPLPDAQSGAMIGLAALRMSEATDGIVAAAADLGTTEARIDAVRTRNSAEETATKARLVEIAGVDPYEAAIDLDATQKQLELLYELTGRLSSLTLTNYLR